MSVHCRSLPTLVARMALVGALLVAFTGCSLRSLAIRTIGNTLAASGDGFESDEDPDLVGDALPFSLKLMDGLVLEAPKHGGLRLACAKGFAAYGYAYVQQPAEIGAPDLATREAAYARARRLYLRALGHARVALEIPYPGIASELDADPARAVTRVRREHVPLLYWTAASLGLAIGMSVDDASMLGRLREVDALVERALALDERWQGGTLHEFALTLEAARPPDGRRDPEAARRHYARAVELSGGQRPGVFVAFAESVMVRDQDAAGYRAALERALAIDAYARRDGRLANLLAQRRARWLLTQEADRFLTEDRRDMRPLAGTGGEL